MNDGERTMDEHTTIHPGEAETSNALLAEKLLALTSPSTNGPGPSGRGGNVTLTDSDAIVSHIEVNDRHGVGVLLRRLFSHQSNVLSIRSKDFYEGRQNFGDQHLRISHDDQTRDSVFARVLGALRGSTVKRVLCVPYFRDDVLTAIALKEIFAARLCTFLMDDQNLHADEIPDAPMRELLEKSSLRLAISPELAMGYEQKYGCKMALMLPVVSTPLILRHLHPLPEDVLRRRAGAIVGNIWGQRWLHLLRETVRHSGITLRWFCNSEFEWVACGLEELGADGIVPHAGPALPDTELVDELRRTPFVVVPSGVLDDTDDRRFIAQVSLPSRIPFIIATSQAPMLVLGSSATGAARFVTRTGTGLVAPYNREAFRQAVERISRPEVNLAMRQAALLVAPRLVDIGAAEWIWESLERGVPVDARYQDFMPSRDGQNG
jgi:hypothetical protein